MPQNTWGDKRERQYHIKDGELRRGRSLGGAGEVAARTVNEERAGLGESRNASHSSIDDISSGRRGGRRSHDGPDGRTFEPLYAEAQRSAKGLSVAPG